MTEHHTYLTSAEIASLWTAYMNDSMSYCVLGIMLENIHDEEIKAVVQSSYNMSERHMKQLITMFNEEGYAIPKGFTPEEDVHQHTPWLFSDVFCLSYIKNMSTLGLIAYSGALSMSTREDICDYFTVCLNETAILYNQSEKEGLEKGITSRPPYIEVPKETDYVDSKKYLSGLNPFSEKRPLNAIEISYLYMNVMTNAIGSNLCLAFAQTSPNKDVQEFMLRSNDYAKKHIQAFITPLLNEDVLIPKAPDVNVSNSTTQTFSDKLMMFQIFQMSAAGIGNYAKAAAASQRTDLALKYEKLSLEISGLAKSGADIMIKYNWLEQPPGIKNRNKLAREKS